MSSSIYLSIVYHRKYDGNSGLLYLSFTTACLATILNILTKAIFEVLKYSIIHGGIIGNFISWDILFYSIIATGFSIAKMVYVGYGLADYHHMLFLPIYHVSKCYYVEFSLVCIT